MNRSLLGARILIVDDDMLVMMQAADLLSEHGCVTSAAPTVEDAIKLIDGEPFDAAMLDMNLGGTKAFPVADALIISAIPFLFATGYVSIKYPDIYSNVPVLRKPFRPYQLIETITNIMLAKTFG